MTEPEILDNLKRLGEAAMEVARITEQPLGTPGPYTEHSNRLHGQPSDLDRFRALFDSVGVKYEVWNFQPGRAIRCNFSGHDMKVQFEADGKFHGIEVY